MKRPKKVEIGGLKYKILYIKPGRDPEKLDTLEVGSVNQVKQVIYVAVDSTPEMTLQILLHEFLHAIGDSMNPNSKPFKDEKFTHTVSHLLMQALKSSGLVKV